MTDQLLSIEDAWKQRVARLRRPIWANPLDHLKLDLIGENRHGPWVHLFSPFNQECNGRDPVDLLCIQIDCAERAYVPYTGPLPDSEEYKADQERFRGALSDAGPKAV